jgi:hypothetical protein
MPAPYNPLLAPGLVPPDNPLQAGTPTLADAWQYNANAVGNYVAQQRALPPQSWPQIAGMYANALMAGTIAPEASPMRLFHGTRENLTKFPPGATYLTDNPAESMGYAQGAHLGGSGSGPPTVLAVDAKPGATLDANPHLADAMENDDDLGDAVDGAIAQARNQGHRYVTYNHPSNLGPDAPDQNVTVSLYPHEDLQIVGPHQP